MRDIEREREREREMAGFLRNPFPKKLPEGPVSEREREGELRVQWTLYTVSLPSFTFGGF